MMVTTDTRAGVATMDESESLPPAALSYENLRTLVTAVPVAAALAAAGILIGAEVVTVATLWVLLPLCVIGTALDLAVINRLQYRAYRFSVVRGAVEIQHGIVLRSRTTVSAVQVLSVDLVQGPLLRAKGLTVVALRTVGGSVKLGPVCPATADRVRSQVLKALDGAT